MTGRKTRSTSTSKSPSSNIRPAVNTPLRSSNPNNNSSHCTRPPKNKTKSSSPITTATAIAPPPSDSPRQQQQSPSYSKRKSSSPSHTRSSRRYRRQLSHQPSQQTLLDNTGSSYSYDEDFISSPSTSSPFKYGNFNSRRFDLGLDSNGNPTVLVPLTIPQGVYMSDTCTREGQRTPSSYSTLSLSPRSSNQDCSRSRTRTGSEVPASRSPPPPTSHPEEGGLPKIITLKQTEVRAWVRKKGG
jgi:hypothetical protein